MGRYQRDIHTLLNYLYSHIVYSNKSCMFEVLQRCSQPNTTIMKINKNNYEGVQNLEGMYINQHLWSDSNPVGKIISTRGKNFVTIQPVEAGDNKTKMEFVTGGFSAICLNDSKQEYDFFEVGEPFEVRLSKAQLSNKYWHIEKAPFKRYDFNF